MRRVKGLTNLLFDTVEHVTNLVERTHASTASRVFRSVPATEATATATNTVQAVHDLTSGSVYRAIHGINLGVRTLVNVGIDWRLGNTPQARPGEASELPRNSDAKTARDNGAFIDRAESTLNALFGDYLHDRQNGLDLGLSLRHKGKELPVKRRILEENIPGGTGKIVLFIHGLFGTEWAWRGSGPESSGDLDVGFGSLLKKELGYTPLYLRYNTGRHVSENGQLLSALLSQLVDEYPHKVKEIVLVGHSMGGLLARSAAYYGGKQKAAWLGRLRHIVCLGTPNLGAPLEKGINLMSSVLSAVNTAGTRVPAEILNARSAGVKDLRFGYTVGGEWKGRDPDDLLDDNRHDVPPVDGVDYHFIAATVTRNPRHPIGTLIGDLVVRLPSAAGRSRISARHMPFGSKQVLSGINHLRLTNDPQVYRAIKRYLSA